MGLTPLLAAIVSGRALPLASWPQQEIWDAARGEAMQAVLADTLLSADWPGADALKRAARSELAAAAARYALLERDNLRVLGRLAADGVTPVLIKGAALACTHYTRPHLRPRIDTDLLIAERDAPRVRTTFESLGATLDRHVTGRLIMPQFHYDTRDESGCVHSYDVHWRIAVPPLFANLLCWNEIADEAVPVGALRGARAASPVHALLLACVHRAAHHQSGGPLIWLYDIHLLCERMTGPDLTRVRDTAFDRRIVAVVSRAVGDAHAAFGGEQTKWLASEMVASGKREPTASSLQPRSRARAALDDLRALSWRQRAVMLKELLVPPGDYMRSTYAPGSRTPLPLLYLRRIAWGVRRWSHL